MSEESTAALLQRAGQWALRMREDGQGLDAELIDDLIDAIKSAIGTSTREQQQGPTSLVVVVATAKPTLTYITYRTKSGKVTSAFSDITKGISMPSGATLLAAGVVGPNTPQPPASTLDHSIGGPNEEAK